MQFTNRELSWLEFNQRVLEEACRPEAPLLERLKFLSITDSNLDEFFQVRVGGLSMLLTSRPRKTDLSGLTPTQQISAIRRRTTSFIRDQYTLLNDDLLPALEKAGIRILSAHELSEPQDRQLAGYFSDMIYPLLTPLAVDEQGTPPSLLSLIHI